MSKAPTGPASAPAGPDLTGLLQAWSQGDREALAALAPLVQQELRHIARRILADERRDRGKPLRDGAERRSRLSGRALDRRRNHHHTAPEADEGMRQRIFTNSRGIVP